ncbi:MAG: DUF7680 family protein [Thermodesulfobacteriota bacterium]
MKKSGKAPNNHGRHAPLALQLHFERVVKKELGRSPWVLRFTEHADRPAPVLIIKQRLLPEERHDIDNLVAPRSVLKERGLIYGPAQLRCLPVIRAIISRVQDKSGVPLELPRFLEGTRLEFRGNLPLSDEAGCKIALLCKLQERLKELDRVELIARRIERFTLEEAGYWYSRVTSFSEAANRWALAGMKIMLAGHPGDPEVSVMLEKMRSVY